MTTLRTADIRRTASAASAEARSIIPIIGAGVVGGAHAPF
jgi:hypothetical protein